MPHATTTAPGRPRLSELPRTAFQAGKLWALGRSASLRGLLYLPLPRSTVPATRPRRAPTPTRPLDLEALRRGVLRTANGEIALDAPLDWEAEATWPLHHGEEVLALFRQGDADAARRGGALIDDWIEHNPLASMPGWELGCVARRLACWSAAYVERRSDPEAATPPSGISQGQLERWGASMYLAARWLNGNLDLTGPGVLGALRALLGAGAIFSGTEPNGWSESASRRLTRELERHIGGDGGHSDRRPDRQLRAAADLCDALELLPAESDAARAVRERLPLVMELAAALCHPDGRPAGFGGAPELGPLDLGDLAQPQHSEEFCFRTFRDAGYTTFSDRSHGDAVLIDWRGRERVAPFSAACEASFGGRRMIASPAVADGSDATTVLADGTVCPGPRAQLDEVIWGRGPGFAYLGIEAHDGGRALHRRVLAFESRALLVVDRVKGSERRAVSRIHLAPGTRLEAAGQRRLYLEWPDTTATLAWMPGADIETRPSEVVDRDGRRSASTAIDVWVPGGGERLLGWVLAHGRRRDAQMDVIETPEDRLGVRFDPRRYYIAWRRGDTPRVLFAD